MKTDIASFRATQDEFKNLILILECKHAITRLTIITPENDEKVPLQDFINTMEQTHHETCDCKVEISES